eukprot:4075592-Prymnesium_polylepis.1
MGGNLTLWPSCSRSIATSGRERSTRLPWRRSLATGPAYATRFGRRCVAMVLCGGGRSSTLC